MPKKLPVPEAPPRKTGWKVFIYYLDYDDDLHEVLQVKQVYAEDQMQAQLSSSEIQHKGVSLGDEKSFRMIPPHRIQLIVGMAPDA